MFSDFYNAYVEALLWSSSNDEETFEWQDASSELEQNIYDDCKKFYNANLDLIGDRAEEAGHDFALTRNGHGVGFWDGDWPEVEGAALTTACDDFGPMDLYRGDDGKLYN